jgi:anti-sigma factor RsiW
VTVRGHARYEALAGALVLGEATDAERTEFARHARTCAACAADAEELPATAAALRAARDEERWQAPVAAALGARLAATRERSGRRTFGTLGLAIAGSVALNVAFAGGYAGRWLDGLRVTAPPDAPVVATRLTLDVRPRRAREAPRSALAHTARSAVQVTHVDRLAAPAGAHPANPRRPATPAQPQPDVFAGIALGGDERAASIVADCAPSSTASGSMADGCSGGATPADLLR